VDRSGLGPGLGGLLNRKGEKPSCALLVREAGAALRLHPCLVVLVLVAGCVATHQPPEGGTPPPPTRTPAPLTCPPGPVWRIEDGVCAGLVPAPEGVYGEPALAVDGLHVAIAAVANVSRSVPLPLPSLPPLPLARASTRWPCAGFHLCLSATRDGGATWTNASIPGSGAWYDPQVLFAPDGALTVATLTYGADGSSTSIQVTRTTDDGATWTAPTVVSVGNAVDRPWMRSGDRQLVLLYVGESGSVVRGARSLDAGTTWSDAGVLRCRWPSPPVEGEGGAWDFLCSFTDDGEWATRLVRWTPATGTFTPGPSMPWSRWFPALVSAGGRLVAITSHPDAANESSLTVRFADAAGEGWTSPLDLRKASPDLARMKYSCLMGASATSDGLVRVIVEGIAHTAQQGGLCLPRGTAVSVWDVEFDPADGSVVAVRSLGQPDRSAPGGPAGPPVNDDFHSVTPSAMAWSYGGRLAWARFPTHP